MISCFTDCVPLPLVVLARLVSAASKILLRRPEEHQEWPGGVPHTAAIMKSGELWELSAQWAVMVGENYSKPYWNMNTPRRVSPVRNRGQISGCRNRGVFLCHVTTVHPPPMAAFALGIGVLLKILQVILCFGDKLFLSIHMYYFQDLQPTRKPEEEPRLWILLTRDMRFLPLDILNQMSQGKNWDERKVRNRTESGGEKAFTLYLLFLVHEYYKWV